MPQEIVHSLAKRAALDFVQMRSANHSNSCYSTHSHDEFSFGVVDYGSAKYKNLQRNYQIQAGVTVTINPGDAHSCNPDQGEWSYRMLFIDSAWMADLQRQMFAHKHSDYLPFKQNLLKDKHSYQQFDQLYDCLRTESNPLMAEGRLIDYCQQLFADNPQRTSLDATSNSQVQELIMDQLGSNIALTDFCQLANMSPFHLIRSFKHQYGQSPHAYQLDQRIKRARLLLKAGDSLANTATALGFADQSHFQRNFKKRTALTPRQYQQFFVGVPGTGQ